jgi:hypothetical protein
MLQQAMLGSRARWGRWHGFIKRRRCVKHHDQRQQSVCGWMAQGITQKTMQMLAIMGTMALMPTAHAAISYVQGNYASGTNATSIATTLPNAQVAGDINIVVVAWNTSTATVSTVTDTKGNAYTAAGSATVYAGFGGIQFFYAKNIVAAAANSNTVTVTFSTSVHMFKALSGKPEALFCVYQTRAGLLFAWDAPVGARYRYKEGAQNDRINLIVGGTGQFQGATGLWNGSTEYRGLVTQVIPGHRIQEMTIKIMQGYIQLPKQK